MNPAERQRYHKVRQSVRAHTRASDRSGRITVAAIAAALRTAGYDRIPRYARAVLAGEKISRPALREISGAIRMLRRQREGALPDWL